MTHSSGVLEQLAHELGGGVPAAAAQLDHASQEKLVRLIRDAQHRQGAALKQAADDGFDSLPALLRRPVKKILGR
ncbi:hypothetical protein [Hoyosella subflava]|uniref:Uncharacterized protein n=1 Tax=Hoyosella subflava (strain DSM 45089 / JCM 17490 / NBRC 109087 / DQS3-9A1) TaxID=443218 RepID=F6EHQ1_HOYSD|nr:hypothetical protein [Hoyosella subflava]AEF42415.1 hypothetical protein AS9A_3979 [Hoyosella subflava DQS3-9A1]